MSVYDDMTRAAFSRMGFRFWSYVDVNDWQECWPWTGTTDGKGHYGRFKVSGRALQAHRVAYELLAEPVPAELTLDHVRAWGCTTRLCVNPLHLEPVTRGENVRRGGNSLKTRCLRGHAFTPENTYVRNGARECRACIPVRQRARQARTTSRVTL